MLENNRYFAVDEFAGDHWSTFAYAESVIVDHGAFQIGFDARMRQGRVHFRVMQQQCNRPHRNNHGMGVVMDQKYSTTLKSGEQVEGHDDWDCILDLINAGLLAVIVDGQPESDAELAEPGEKVAMTDLGWEYLTALRQHKAAGGKWANFEPKIVEAA